MNFEGFKDLIQRVAIKWYSQSKREITDLEAVDSYLAVNPFTAQQTHDNEEAYERLMDVRMKLFVSKIALSVKVDLRILLHKIGHGNRDHTTSSKRWRSERFI